MTELFFARAQMTLLFAFHIVFAVAGMGMPVLLLAAEWAHRRTGKAVYLELARRWARGTAVLFAVGAVSGTVLSFELGLLWPRFMSFSGGVIGFPFALEGFAFFAEAIFLGIYLYGRDRVTPRVHLLSVALVALGGILSGFFVVTVNGWMNNPAGFVLSGGKAVAVSPLSAMFNPAAPHEILHMILAAFAASGFAVAGIHAARLRRDRNNPFHRAALRIALALGGSAAVLIPVSGDLSARFTARARPEKLAAMEGQFPTERGAPLRIGGIPDVAARRTRYAIEIPKGLSLLAFHDPEAEVAGLDSFPPSDVPDPVPVHLAFQIMVGCGTCLALVSAAGAWLARRRDGLYRPGFLAAVAGAGPLGLVAVEAGWIVTEMGRQPWVVYRIMRTSEAVTPASGLAVPFALFSVLYLALGLATAWLLRREILRAPSFPAEEAPPDIGPRDRKG